MNCVAIDDEPFALKILEEDILKIENIQSAHCFTNLRLAENYLKSNSVQLLFLDIEMPKMTGIEFLKNIENPPMVIFTTAYPEFALDGFELNAIDYLLKPITFPRLEKACQKAFELYSLKQNVKPISPEFIQVFSEYNKLRINIDDIIYIEGLKDYIKIYIQNQPKAIITRMSLKKISLSLPNERFIRIHQSFIVAIDRISSYQKQLIKIDKKELPIGSSYSVEVQARLNQN